MSRTGGDEAKQKLKESTIEINVAFCTKVFAKQSRVGDAEDWRMTRKQTKNMPRAPHAKLLNRVLPMRALEHGIQRRTVTPSELHLA